jgi:hypothetical protein
MKHSRKDFCCLLYVLEYGRHVIAKAGGVRISGGRKKTSIMGQGTPRADSFSNPSLLDRVTDLSTPDPDCRVKEGSSGGVPPWGLGRYPGSLWLSCCKGIARFPCPPASQMPFPA